MLFRSDLICTALPSVLTLAVKFLLSIEPAKLTASVSTEGNAVQIRSAGLNNISLWIGRNSQGKYLLDLDRPITVRHGTTIMWNQKKLPPSLEVLMKDLYDRADRKHLFVAQLKYEVKR